MTITTPTHLRPGRSDRLRRAVGWAAAVLLGGLGACSDDGPTSSTTTQRPSERPTTTVDEAALVLDAYRASWDAATVAFRQPGPEVPAIVTDTNTGLALKGLLQRMSELTEKRHYIDGPVELSPELVEIGTTGAVVEDCVVDRSVLYNSDGQVLNPAGDTPTTLRAVMVYEGHLWKVSTIQFGGSCVP